MVILFSLGLSDIAKEEKDFKKEFGLRFAKFLIIFSIFYRYLFFGKAGWPQITAPASLNTKAGYRLLQFRNTSVVDPNTLNLELDPDPGFWPHLDPDPDPGLYNQF